MSEGGSPLASMQGAPFLGELQEVSDQQDREHEDKEEEGFKPSRGHGDEGRPCLYTVSESQPSTIPGIWRPRPVDNASAGGSPLQVLE